MAFCGAISGSGVSGDTGILKWDGSANNVQLARIGMAARTTGGGTNGTFNAFGVAGETYNMTFNDQGQSAFIADIAAAGASNQGVFVSNGAGLPRYVARTGDSAAGGGTYATFDLGATGSPSTQPLSMNNVGQFLFGADLDPAATTDGAFYRYDFSSDASIKVLRSGDPLVDFDGLNPDTAIISRGPLYLNDNGNIGGYIDVNLKGGAVIADSKLIELGNIPTSVSLNNAGQMSWPHSGLGGIVSGDFATGDITLLIAHGSAAAPGAGNFGNLFNPISLDDQGRVVFKGDSLSQSSFQGVYRAHGPGNLETLALTGRAVPGGGTYLGFDFNGGTVNSGDQVAFRADITGSFSNEGIFVSDGIETIKVVRRGDSAPKGTTITDVQFDAGPDAGGQSPFNDFGQVVYRASLSNGQSGILRFTPEVHYAAPGRPVTPTGNWDDAVNWTISLSPAEVHEVFITPNNGATVNGPSQPTTVQSLTLDAPAAGVTRLDLQVGGALTVRNTLEVAAAAVLDIGGSTIDVTVLANEGTVRGSGTQVGDLEDSGTLSPGDSAGVYTIEGDWDKTGGSVEIELGGLFDGGTNKVQTQYDWLDVTGDVSVSGPAVIKLSYTPGFGAADLSGGERFDIVRAGGNVTGAGNLTLDDSQAVLSGNLSWLLGNDATTIFLQVLGGALLGDANNDNQVTGLDLIFVQQNFGNTGSADGLLLGDANDDGVVSGADLISVQQNFGDVLTSSASPVPEPAMLSLLGPLFGVVVCRRRVASKEDIHGIRVAKGATQRAGIKRGTKQ